MPFGVCFGFFRSIYGKIHDHAGIHHKQMQLDGKPHLLFTETERPCKAAFLEEIKDNDGNICSRYFIEIEDSVESLDALGTKYDVDVIVTRNIDFNNHIALVFARYQHSFSCSLLKNRDGFQAFGNHPYY